MLGASYRWHERFSVTVDPTFIFYTAQVQFNDMPMDRPLGVRIKSDLRYHIRKFILGFKNVFIAPEFTYAHVRTTKTADFGFNCNGPNCAYYMRDDYNEIKTETGIALKGGLTGAITKNNRWNLELFAGLGVSFYDFKEKGIPPNSSFAILPVHEDNLGAVDEDDPNLMIPFGLKISFRLK